MESHEVPEADGGEGDEAVVEGVNVVPVFVVGEDGSPGGHDDGREGARHEELVHVRRLRGGAAEHLLHLPGAS